MIYPRTVRLSLSVGCSTVMVGCEHVPTPADRCSRCSFALCPNPVRQSVRPPYGRADVDGSSKCPTPLFSQLGLRRYQGLSLVVVGDDGLRRARGVALFFTFFFRGP